MTRPFYCSAYCLICGKKLKTLFDYTCSDKCKKERGEIWK